MGVSSRGFQWPFEKVWNNPADAAVYGDFAPDDVFEWVGTDGWTYRLVKEFHPGTGVCWLYTATSLYQDPDGSFPVMDFGDLSPGAYAGIRHFATLSHRPGDE